jgi:uncharacterized membrane protein
MVKTVEEYLAQLKKELSGCDPALVQDALSDAEEHLRTALESALADNPGTDEEALGPIIERYGEPREVASAYRDVEAFLSRVPSPVKRPAKPSFFSRYFGVLTELRAWGAALYSVISLITGIIYFLWSLFGVALSLVTLILIIGLPVTGLFLLSVRGIALMEGRIVEALLEVRMPRKPLFVRPELGWKDRYKSIVTDSHTWKSLLYLILQFPLGMLSGGTAVFLFALSLKAILYPLLDWTFHRPLITLGSQPFHTSPWLFPLISVVGIVLFALALHFAKLAAGIHGRYAKLMLVKKP